VPAAVTQFRWDYVMESGIRALTAALALRLPGDYAPLEGLGVTDQQESVAGLSGHSLLTAFPLKCGSLGVGQWSGGRPGVCDGLAPAQSPSEGWQ